ncbi:MAG: transglutaminase-like cysteine peptidase [Betaproteobacteria bacterium]|nr:transglutaminase-like cysteine peptidase [Betaproteobacteria bacterium]
MCWGQVDYWATLLDTASKNAGDCEDFAIAKYVSLINSGMDENKLRLTYVLARVQSNGKSISEPHMVLAYYPDPGAEPLILDNPDFRDPGGFHPNRFGAHLFV